MGRSGAQSTVELSCVGLHDFNDTFATLLCVYRQGSVDSGRRSSDEVDAQVYSTAAAVHADRQRYRFLQLVAGGAAAQRSVPWSCW